jgi:carbon monoxide dehydrogenase subunit G
LFNLKNISPVLPDAINTFSYKVIKCDEMQLSGKRVFNAEISTIWSLLMNAETLARIIPGIIALEKTAENSYKSFLAVKVGPVNSTFEGSVRLEDINEHSHFTMHVQQNSKIGNGTAQIKIRFNSLNETQSEIQFDGDIKLTGLLAGIGQRLMGSVANTLTNDFFSNMEKELQLQSAS